MSEIETQGLLEEIQALVSDHLQVVSYKWLSRQYLVSSNAAKKLLLEFVDKHGNELEVIYSVAGWLKESPPTYHIRLVPKPKLAEAKHDFDGNCSVQVYSVQSCIPKDPTAIWNAEFIQAEELFKQPLTVDNCLRDNRFCGVSNSLVQRQTEGAALAVSAPQSKGAGVPHQAVGNSANQQSSGLQQQQQKKLPQSSSKSSNTAVKTETDNSAGCNLPKEASKDKRPLPAANKKGQSDKSPAFGASLANLWGRASSKPKSTNSCKEEKSGGQNKGVPDSSDAQINALENLEAASSDDEPDVNFRRASNGDGGKKRRVVFDDSDEDDYGPAVNLGSPDPPPKGKSVLDRIQKNETLAAKNKVLTDDDQEEIKPVVKEEKVRAPDIKVPPKNESPALDQCKNVKIASAEDESGNTTGLSSSITKNKMVESRPASPKRRKVLKTRIDERGREVTEVVWEGDEKDTKQNNTGKSSIDNGKNTNGHSVKLEDKPVTNPVHRAATTKKSPATGNTAPANAGGKAGGKKGANAKDPKQGNILSFFKKA